MAPSFAFLLVITLACLRLLVDGWGCYLIAFRGLIFMGAIVPVREHAAWVLRSFVLFDRVAGLFVYVLFCLHFVIDGYILWLLLWVIVLLRLGWIC